MKPSRRPKGSAAEAGAVAVRVVRDLAPAAVLTDLAAGVAVRAVQDSARVVVLTTLWVRGGGAGGGEGAAGPAGSGFRGGLAPGGATAEEKADLDPFGGANDPKKPLL